MHEAINNQSQSKSKCKVMRVRAYKYTAYCVRRACSVQHYFKNNGFVKCHGRASSSSSMHDEVIVNWTTLWTRRTDVNVPSFQRLQIWLRGIIIQSVPRSIHRFLRKSINGQLQFVTSFDQHRQLLAKFVLHSNFLCLFLDFRFDRSTIVNQIFLWVWRWLCNFRLRS